MTLICNSSNDQPHFGNHSFNDYKPKAGGNFKLSYQSLQDCFTGKDYASASDYP